MDPQFLIDLREYLENRADVDDGIPNDAMRLLVQLDEIELFSEPKMEPL